MFRSVMPVAVVVACAVLEGYALARTGSQPSNDGVRRYVLGEIAGELTAGQTLALRADGLSSVTIHPRATNDRATGSATLELRDVTTDPPVVIRQVTKPVAELVAEGEVTLAFPPQRSFARRYEMELRVTGAARGQGLGLLATRGDGYRDGRLRVIGRNRFGDLVFDTTVEGARSNFEVLASRLTAAGVPAAALVLVAAMLGKNAALLLILRALFTAGEPDAA